MRISPRQAQAIRSNPDELRRIRYGEAIKAEQKANKDTWKSCLWCWQVAGKYQKGGVLGLADDMGKSDDTVYDRAHAYEIFVELCNHDDGRHRFFVHTVRRLPFIYWSHFRALWDAKRDFELTTEQVLDLLMEVYQAEGGISSRGLSEVVKRKLGVDRPWTYYADKIIADIDKALGHPNTPRKIRSSLKKTKNSLVKKSPVR